MVCLLETRVKEHKIQSIVDKWFAGWKLLHNYSYALNERLWMLWKPGLQVSLIAMTDQSITSSIQYDEATQFYFTAIYGCNDGGDRRRL